MTSAAAAHAAGAHAILLHRRVRWTLTLGALALYTVTLCPTVHWGDSGELIAAGAVLGIAHPPGHPLYSILAHLFSWLPFGTPAWRINWLSAVCGAVAVALTFELAADTLRRLNTPPRRTAVCAALAAGLFAVTAGLWGDSTIAETTTLHAAFMAALVLLVWRIAWVRPAGAPLTQALGTAAALYGFSATNHVAGIFFLPAFACVLLVRCGREVLHPRNVAIMFACVLAGLSLYAFLPLRSLQNPPLDWGNPETPANLWWVISARQYRADIASRVDGPLATAVLAALASRARTVMLEWTPVGTMLIGLGAAVTARSVLWLPVFVVLGVAPLAALGFSSAFILAYFVPALLLLAVLLAVGAATVAARLRGTAPVAAVAAAAGLVGWNGVTHYRDSARQHDRSAEVYGRTVLAELEPNAVLLAEGQYKLMLSWFLQMVEGHRTDVAVFPASWAVGDTGLREDLEQQHPDLQFLPGGALPATAARWGLSRNAPDLPLLAWLGANAGRRPVYVEVLEGPTALRANLEPQGDVMRFRPTTGPHVGADTVARTDAYWTAWVDRLRAEPHLRTVELVDELMTDLNNQALFFERLGRPDLALANYETGTRMAPDRAFPLMNIGRLRATAGNWPGAMDAYAAAVEREPNDAEAHHALGVAREATGDLIGARVSYTDALNRAPTRSATHRRLGLLLLRTNEREPARAHLQRALELDPTDGAAARGLVRIALTAGDYPAAARALRLAQRVEPESAPGWLLAAELAVRTNRRNEAAAALQRALDVDSDMARAFIARTGWARGLMPPARTPERAE